MLKQSLAKADPPTGSEGADPTVRPPAPEPVVVVRNYDHEAGHSVKVTVSDTTGETELIERCYLAPGQSRRLSARLPPAEFRIDARVDGVVRTASEQWIDGDGARPTMVELGAGAVSISPVPDRLLRG